MAAQPVLYGANDLWLQRALDREGAKEAGVDGASGAGLTSHRGLVFGVAQAVPIPYHHSNLQSEEMIYYVSGKFRSRRGVDVGSLDDGKYAYSWYENAQDGAADEASVDGDASGAGLTSHF